MKPSKTKIFLTGATGVMGSAALEEFIKYPEKYLVTVLARNSKRNWKKLKPYKEKGVKVVWGDLLDERSLKTGIEESDIVLHVGGMVSPLADLYPEKTLEVNIGSMRLISKIVKEIEEKDPQRTIKVVYIGSVSQYGSKNPPNHWGKAGDILSPAKLDAYAVSKVMAERILVETGLKKWVSIRQTSILHEGLLKNATNPVAFHTPIEGVLEWITKEDSGRLLERVCRDDVPDEFWGNFYNAGGGEKFRLTNLEFERGILKGLNCPAPEKVFEPNWFATDNFHGMWFLDSDKLDDYLHYREPDTFEEAIKRLKKKLPVYYNLAPVVPSVLIKTFMKIVASKPGLGPLWWIKHNDEERIKISWGSKENYQKIPAWKEFMEQKYERITPTHYKNNMGSKTLNTSATPLDTRLRKEKCESGHEYFTSDALLAGGHSCPYCLFINSGVDSPKNC